MRERILFLLAVPAALFAACGASTAVPDGDGSGGVIGLPGCSADGPPLDEALESGPASDANSVWCGGEIELGGVTPFGVFSPTAISGSVGPPNDQYLDVTVAENPISVSPGQQLTFRVPLDPNTQTYLGTHDLVGFIEDGGQVVPVAVVADITTATAPYASDGGPPNPGAARIVVTVTTDCGTLNGTLTVRYCEWQIVEPTRP
jgi:hypothetical protein